MKTTFHHISLSLGMWTNGNYENKSQYNTSKKIIQQCNYKYEWLYKEGLLYAIALINSIKGPSYNKISVN